jgi:hypothetical protein
MTLPPVARRSRAARSASTPTARPTAWCHAGLRMPGVKGVFDTPEHLLTSFHTILIVEFGGHLPTLTSF